MRGVCLPRGRAQVILDKLLFPHHNVVMRIHPAGDRGRVLRTIEAANLIPTDGREIVAYLLANRGYAPSSVALGTDGTDTDEETDALGTEVYRAVLDTRQVSGGRVLYEMFLAETEANGYTLREAGLFADQVWHSGVVTPGAGTLFARVIHAPVVKTTAVSVTYSWEIPIGSG